MLLHSKSDCALVGKVLKKKEGGRGRGEGGRKGMDGERRGGWMDEWINVLSLGVRDL